MATVPESAAATERLELHSGDRMTREEFHRIYEQMPDDFEAELVGGTVYVSSPSSAGTAPIICLLAHCFSLTRDTRQASNRATTPPSC